jgi:CRISPR/Cas system CMR subunit Cmr6 (Cas7 group RAMP superfamily)
MKQVIFSLCQNDMNGRIKFQNFLQKEYLTMAEWRKVAKALALTDGHIQEKEVNILREAIFKDNAISQSELDFLKELKSEAKTAVKSLDKLIEDCEAAKKQG